MWFTELSGGRIGRITTAGAVTEFPAGVMPGGYVEGITAGPDGAIWFTEPVDARIGRITTAGAVTHVRVGAVGTRQPESITVGPDGNLWFTEAAGPRLGRLTPAGVLTEYPLSLADVGRPTQIARGPNRTIWFTSSPNQVVRVLAGAGGDDRHCDDRHRHERADRGDGRPVRLLHRLPGGVRAHDGLRLDTETEIALPAPGPVAVSVPLARLAPGTRYHYRLVASSFAGSEQGADGTFTTPGPPGAGAVGGGAARDRAGPRMRIGRGPLVVRRGRVAVRLGCPLSEPLGCRGRVRSCAAGGRCGCGRWRAPSTTRATSARRRGGWW